jgi:hypothetical protein
MTHQFDLLFQHIMEDLDEKTKRLNRLQNIIRNLAINDYEIAINEFKKKTALQKNAIDNYINFITNNNLQNSPIVKSFEKELKKYI